MAEVLIERRKFARKRVKLSCHMQIGSGVRVRGFTRDLSQEGAMLEFQHLPSVQQNSAPKTGDTGSLTLHYHKQGAPESMKIGCRIMHTQANRIGLLLFYSKMSDLDKQSLDIILKTESGNI
ncbi:MAG: PilZ domain-containing protein [Gammaproteobacteria bacterium]